MERAATALSGRRPVPWDADAEPAGRRPTWCGWSARATGSWPPRRATSTPPRFDPDGDLLAYVTDLQMTSLVGMVDPPRDESKAAVAEAQAAHIRVRMVTGDDVTTGAAIAEQLGIPGEAILGADFAALSERSGWPGSTTSASSAGSHPSTRCCSPTR